MGLAKEGKAEQATNEMKPEVSSPSPFAFLTLNSSDSQKYKMKKNGLGDREWQVHVADLETL